MKNDTDTAESGRARIGAYVSSFIIVLSAFFFLAKHLISTYKPEVKLEPYIYRGWELSSPENEIQVYIIGYIFIFLLGFALFTFVDTFLKKRNLPDRSIIADGLIRCSVLILLISWFTLIRIDSENLIFSAFFPVISFLSLVGVLINSPSALLKSVRKILYFSDIAIAAALIGISIFFLIQSVVTEYFQSNDAIRFFQQEKFAYFRGFSGFDFISVLAIIFAFYILYNYFHFRHLKRTHLLRTQVIIDCISLVCIVFYISIVVPWSPLNWAGPADYGPVVGVVNDILGGKTVLVDSHSIYGLLMPYVISIYFHFIPLTSNSFFILNYLTTILGYSFIYIILRLWFKNSLIPMFWILLVPLYHYFAQVTNILFFSQSTFIRFGMWVLLFLVLILKDLYHEEKIVPKYLDLVLVVVAVFWAFDTGTYIFLSYAVYLLFKSFFEKKSYLEAIINFLRSLSYLMGFIFIIFLLIHFFTYIRSGHYPNWAEYTYFTGAVSNGFGLSKLPQIGSYMLFILLHFGLALFLLYELAVISRFRSGGHQDIPLVGFLTTYTILQFLYYIGQSAGGNIHTISLTSFMLLAWVINRFLDTKKVLFEKYFRKSELILAHSVGILIFIFFAIVLTVSLVNLKNAFKLRGPLEYASKSNFPDNKTNESIQWLRNHYRNIPPYQRKIAIIAHEEWIFHTETQSTNVFDSNTLNYFLLKSQYYDLCKQLIERSPMEVYIQKSDYWGGYTDILRECASKHYLFSENIGFLDRWVKQ